MTLEKIKDYLRIDFNDDNDFLLDLIEISEIYIEKLIGENYKTDAKAIKLAELLQYKLIADMYENRTINIACNIKQDKITSSILDVLSLYSE